MNVNAEEEISTGERWRLLPSGMCLLSGPRSLHERAWLRRLSQQRQRPLECRALRLRVLWWPDDLIVAISGEERSWRANQLNSAPQRR